jgi:membrane protein YqaA with SNARE-associated domain
MNQPPDAETAAPPAAEVARPGHQPFGWQHALSLLLAVGISVAIYLFYDRLGDLQSLAYLGGFIAMLVGNATVVLPVPGLILVYILGGRLNPLLLGLAAGPGAALGEMTGYFAGYGGSALIDNVALYRRIKGWMDRYGLAVISVLAAIPNPAFDMAGIVAGSLRLKWWQFLLAAAIGKTIQAITVAYAGHLSLGWVRGLLE